MVDSHKLSQNRKHYEPTSISKLVFNNVCNGACVLTQCAVKTVVRTQRPTGQECDELEADYVGCVKTQCAYL